MRRLLAFLRGLFARPVVRWEDGERVTDPATLAHYARLYAETVERIRAVRPDAIQTPTMNVTVRLYDRFPAESASLWGRVLAPNVIAGDTGGTLGMKRAVASDGLFCHEARHAITGISDHPSWLFDNLNP